MSAPLSGWTLALRRSVREGARDPGPAYALPLLPTLLLVVVFISLFDRLVALPGFDAADYADYLAPGAAVLAALLGGGFTATSLITDVRHGFNDRLRLLPASSRGLVLGRLTFEALRVIPAIGVVLLVARLLGAESVGGGGGIAVTILLCALLSAAYAGLFYAVGLSTLDPATPAALAPLGLVFGFLSTALVPAATMPRWAEAVARWNPASAVVEGVRAALSGAVASQEVALAATVCGAAIAIGWVAAARRTGHRDGVVRGPRSASAATAGTGAVNMTIMDTTPNLLRDSGIVFGRVSRDAGRKASLAFVAPSLLALAIVLIFDTVYGQIADVPGFPAPSFIDWVAPGGVMLSVFVGAGFTATALVEDIRSGYLDRLRLLPMDPTAVLLGRAAFDAVRALVPAALVLAVSLALGARNAGGAGAVAGVLGLAALLAVGWNGLFTLVALKTANPAAIQGLQPVFMPVIMFSTFWVPTAFMPGWYEAVARANPLTPVLTGTRGLLAGQPEWGAIALSVVLLASLAALTYGLSVRSLRRFITGT